MLKKPELTIYLTNNCNLTCKHCYNGRSEGNKELTIDDLNWLLENVENKRTTFLGGEPMLYPLLEDALDAFPKVTVSTNGMLVNEDNVHILKKAIGVQLSTEIGVGETNFIRGKDVWETVMHVGDLLQSEGIEYYFRASFWEGNLGYLKEFIEMEAPLALFPRLDKPPLPPQLTSKLFEEVLKHENWILALPNFLQYLRKNGRCKAATERINIYYDKKITPCNFDLEYHLGRIGDDVERIEVNIENFVLNNKIVPPSCMGCKNVEVCRGSCYASHVYEGCPLRYDFSISDFMDRYKISEGDMKQQTLRVTNFMKRMLVC
jgi:radical SAM protein with 4Fe4S-binding SPASM domain